MSRRTKLLITALFLVLLAIPATHVALTWHPAFPLRFRLESVDPEPAKRDAYPERTLRVRVENTGSIPVHFSGALIEANFGRVVSPGVAHGMLWAQEYSDNDPGPYLSESLIIPAHGELHIRGSGVAELAHIPQGGEILVHCGWQTETHARVVRVMDWVSDHCPQWVAEQMPDIEELETTTPLELDHPEE